MSGQLAPLRSLLLVCLFLLAASCDRTSVRGPAGEAPGEAAGPRSVDAGVLFVYKDTAAQSVHLAGTFNDWSTSADAMTKDAQGRWTLVKPIAAGTHQYKFVVNGGQAWEPDPNNPQKADDGFGGHNSVLEVTNSGVKSMAPSSPSEAGKKVAAEGGPQKADKGWLFTFASTSAQSVHLAGSFNNWSTSADPMTKNAAGVWTLVKALPSGEHQYKFVVNGSEWKEDPANPNSADDGFGGNNSLLVVP